MQKYFYFLLMLSLSISSQAQSFISVKETKLMKGGQPYHFMGTNLWYAINLASAGAGGDRPRLLRELDHLKSIGITNVRIMAASEGPSSEPGRMQPALQESPGVYNNDLLEALDFLMAELAKREIYAVVCLNNFWPWSGGMAQYYSWSKKNVAIPYPPIIGTNEWWTYMEFASKFYTNRKAKKTFRLHLKKIINRTNSITGVAYKNDPTIMAWEIANEPRGMEKPRAYRRWIRKTARYIKKLDRNHLLTIGSEGNTANPNGNDFYKDHKYKHIDYTTIHIWVQNWGWYDPHQVDSTFDTGLDKAKAYIDEHLAIAKKLNKPLVLEEFGISRDLDDHDPLAATLVRDKYYQLMFDAVYQHAKEGGPMAGCNFWAWSGEGRPAKPKAVWKAGDDFTGDPPHEFQGWYSVYEKDETTIRVIKKYANMLNQLF